MSDPDTYTAVFKRDSAGMWLVELVEEPRVHSYGRSLVKARANIADAAALWFEVDADDLRLVEDIRLPGRVGAEVDRARRGRQSAEAAQGKAADATRSAARALVADAGLSVRDAGAVLGLSHQRVQQLVETRGAAADASSPAAPGELRLRRAKA